MTITVLSDGTVSVEGPIHDRMLCYFMLMMARDMIKDQKPNLVIPPGGLL